MTDSDHPLMVEYHEIDGVQTQALVFATRSPPLYLQQVGRGRRRAPPRGGAYRHRVTAFKLLGRETIEAKYSTAPLRDLNDDRETSKYGA